MNTWINGYLMNKNLLKNELGNFWMNEYKIMRWKRYKYMNSLVNEMNRWVNDFMNKLIKKLQNNPINDWMNNYKRLNKKMNT